MLFILAMDPLHKPLDIATQQGLLTPIGADPIKMRTSLYADDAMLFLRLIATDIANLQQLLQHLGSATGLCANIQKSQLFPIRCDSINIPEILGQFPVQQGQFPCKYLVLTLRIGRVKREDEQQLIDKVAGKLPWWKGKLLNKTGRLTLINLALTPVVLYYMTVFPLSKWAIRKIDRIRRKFLWHGAEETRKGNCQVNWKWVLLPKGKGGLGILDIGKFNRALRLRWQWLKWKNPDKPLSSMLVSLTEEENALFQACTNISVGNGCRISFWGDRWLGGQRQKT
jgi:hypothetical protein